MLVVQALPLFIPCLECLHHPSSPWSLHLRQLSCIPPLEFSPTFSSAGTPFLMPKQIEMPSIPPTPVLPSPPVPPLATVLITLCDGLGVQGLVLLPPLRAHTGLGSQMQSL